MAPADAKTIPVVRIRKGTAEITVNEADFEKVYEPDGWDRIEKKDKDDAVGDKSNPEGTGEVAEGDASSEGMDEQKGESLQSEGEDPIVARFGVPLEKLGKSDAIEFANEIGAEFADGAGVGDVRDAIAAKLAE